ncbi:MAG: hypothetical protein ABR591_01330 [Candidatus Velthaea sp.]
MAIDYHTYFFAIFTMLAAYFDWRTIALLAALTAGHHLALDLLFPRVCFPTVAAWGASHCTP